jgi:TRAP-type C4-dicarboxylate transport system substrate-binding protein
MAGLVTKIGFASAGLLWAGACAAQTTLTFNKFIPATHPYQVHIMDVWAKDVAAATQGRIKIEFTGSSLAPPPRQFELVSGGGADLAFSVIGYNPDRFPRHNILSLPMLGPNAKATTAAFWAMNAKYFEPAGEFKGVKMITLWANMPGQIYTAKPVSTIADYAGIKTRVGDRVLGNTVKALGGVPVFAPAPQTYEMISQGVLTGAALPGTDILAFKVEKFVPNAVLVPGGIFAGSFYIAMNPKKWDSLPEADRAAIDRISGAALATKAAAVLDELEVKAIAALRAGGAKLSAPSEAYMKDAMARFAEVDAEWTKQAGKDGFDAAAALAEFRKRAAQ